MNIFVGTSLECDALAAIADKLLGYPTGNTSWTHVGGGRHVEMPAKPGAPGWTKEHGAVRQHPTNPLLCAYPIDAALEAAAAGDTSKLSGTEKTTLTTSIAAKQTLTSDWIPTATVEI
jgi:hypothetical protein